VNRTDLSGAAWRKSTRSNGQYACVEVAVTDPGVAVRDSKNRKGLVLVFFPQEWQAFTDGVRNGEFDLG
jgi:Domain of unknown function (DUF397)